MQDQDTIADETVRIPLYGQDGTLRAYALIDADALPLIGVARWRLDCGYAKRRITNRQAGYDIRLALERVVMGLPPERDGYVVDHIDRDPLNCRRKNLRVIPKVGNDQNRPSYSGSSSQHRGVYWKQSKQRWFAAVRVNGRHIHLGSFRREVDAAEAARLGRLRLLPFAVD